MKKSLLIILAIAICTSFSFSEESNQKEEINGKEENFQLRQVYYSHKQNICTEAGPPYNITQVQLQFTFEDGREPFIAINLDGGTTCPGGWNPFDEVLVGPTIVYQNQDCPWWIDESQCNKVILEQQEIKSRVFGKLLGVWAKVTRVREAHFKKEQFDCVIKGDGTVQHFYVYNVYDRPIVRAHCTKKNQTTKTKSEVKME